MRKKLLVVYFALDLIFPYAILVYSLSTGLEMNWWGGLSMFFSLLVASLYGYILTTTFPQDTVAMWKQIGKQVFVIGINFVAFIGAWQVGLQQWSVSVVSALLVGLGLGLLAIMRLDKTTITRLVTALFGIPLIIAGVAWLWALRPELLPLAILSWGLWLGGWLEHTKQRFSFIYQYFKQYYETHRL